MCLKVYPNGSGDGLGTHVSIFTCIMQGSFDGSLSWPFQGDVTIQVMNQAGENGHLEEVNDYTDQTPDVYTSMVIDKERSDGWGFPQFLSHSSLDCNAARNVQYLKRDSIRIQISKVDLKN